MPSSPLFGLMQLSIRVQLKAVIGSAHDPWQLKVIPWLILIYSRTSKISMHVKQKEILAEDGSARELTTLRQQMRRGTSSLTSLPPPSPTSSFIKLSLMRRLAPDCVQKWKIFPHFLAMLKEFSGSKYKNLNGVYAVELVYRKENTTWRKENMQALVSEAISQKGKNGRRTINQPGPTYLHIVEYTSSPWFLTGPPGNIVTFSQAANWYLYKSRSPSINWIYSLKNGSWGGFSPR